MRVSNFPLDAAISPAFANTFSVYRKQHEFERAMDCNIFRLNPYHLQVLFILNKDQIKTIKGKRKVPKNIAEGFAGLDLNSGWN